MYPDELQVDKENTDKYEANFLDLNMKIKNRKFRFGIFSKRNLFSFSIVRMPDKSSHVPSSTVYSGIGAESAIIALISRQGFCIKKTNSVILKFLNKYHRNLNNISQSNPELI